MTKNDEELIRQALIARGAKGKALEKAMKEIKEQKLSFNDLIDKFVAKADSDPHSISNQNCQSGKCMAWDIDKEGN